MGVSKPTKEHVFTDADAREFYADYRKQLSRAERFEEALWQIAGDTPTSHRRTVDQLTDAVKWRRGIARDALSKDLP